MNKKLLHRLILFVFGFDFIIYGILFNNIKFIIFGIINIVILIFLLGSIDPEEEKKKEINSNVISRNEPKKGAGMSLFIVLMVVLILAALFFNKDINMMGKIQSLLGDNSTGEQITSNLDETGISVSEIEVKNLTGLASGDVENMTGITLTGNNNADTGDKIETTNDNTNNNISTGKYLSYYYLIPHIVKTYGLEEKNTKNVLFTLIKNTDPNYKYFKAAYDNRLIATTVKPASIMSCDTYIMLVGLAKGWKGALSTFRAQAEKEGILNGCNKGAYMKESNL